jgi:hypothetical protein
VQQLRRTQTKQIEQIGIETNDAATDARVELIVEASATTQHAVHELAHPTAIARIETHRAPVERRVEQFTRAQIRANLGGRDARVGHAARARSTAVNGNTSKRMIAI